MIAEAGGNFIREIRTGLRKYYQGQTCNQRDQHQNHRDPSGDIFATNRGKQPDHRHTKHASAAHGK